MSHSSLFFALVALESNCSTLKYIGGDIGRKVIKLLTIFIAKHFWEDGLGSEVSEATQKGCSQIVLLSKKGCKIMGWQITQSVLHGRLKVSCPQIVVHWFIHIALLSIGLSHKVCPVYKFYCIAFWYMAVHWWVLLWDAMHWAFTKSECACLSTNAPSTTDWAVKCSQPRLNESKTK